MSEGGHTIHFKDVNYGRNKKKIVVVLHSSKTHYLSQKPQLITINGFDDVKDAGTWYNILKYCPYKLIVDYIAARGPQCRGNEYFFHFQGWNTYQS